MARCPVSALCFLLVSLSFAIVLLNLGYERAVRFEPKGARDGQAFGRRLSMAKTSSKAAKWANELEEVSYPPVNFSSVEETLRARRIEIEDRCRRTLSAEDLARPPNSKEFLISGRYNLVWCNVFKAASSNWLYNFLLMAGFTEKELQKSSSSPVELARQEAYARPSRDELVAAMENPGATSFMIVRDPFERLLSAYKDKIESTKQKFYRTLRCQIQHRATKTTRDCQPTFPEFVDYLLEERAKGKAPNEHWAPYHSFCSPCQLPFDYVLRFESLLEEEAFLVAKVPGLSAVVKPHKLHASHTDYSAVTRQYFSQLSPLKLARLYDIYRNDFIIFGYNATRYWEYVGAVF
ncbi:carbohydrate sulfotransferase 13-like [Penaeus chinensis]|uniref:carbohydrate sulfotransferase 13-like n=1 Tax=Penaeus chinensis TaxID=139456 RepID=UPI001FB7F9E8|nr:carbohydrate sulfotransferase 13-like [Penaeus chinensis]XP_047484467.1 carbohydrate sulfotransferase 13-like [Penaeus chinensis]